MLEEYEKVRGGCKRHEKDAEQSYSSRYNFHLPEPIGSGMRGCDRAYIYSNNFTCYRQSSGTRTCH